MLEVNIEKRFKNLKFHYDFKTDSRRVVIFGPSGAGKSNLLKMIAGFYSPDAGYISVKGKTYFDKVKKINLPIFSRNIGYITQEYTLFPNMTVRENILYGIKRKKICLIEDSFKKLLSVLEIGEKLDEYPQKLSGGQRQRVALARALLVNPEILLFDEPFSALDKPIKDRLIETLINILSQSELSLLSDNTPSIFVTHSIEDAHILGDTLIILADGKVVEYGKKEDIFNNPTYLKSAILLNFKNIYKIQKIDKPKEVTFLNKRFICKNIKDGTYICIRPENVMVVREDADFSEKENLIFAKVSQIKNIGVSYELVTVTPFNEKIYVNLPAHAFEKMDIFIGKEIPLSLKSESLIILKEDMQ